MMHNLKDICKKHMKTSAACQADSPLSKRQEHTVPRLMTMLPTCATRSFLAYRAATGTCTIVGFLRARRQLCTPNLVNLGLCLPVGPVLHTMLANKA